MDVPAPRAVPAPPAVPGRVREAAAALRQKADRFEVLLQEALFAWSFAPETYRAPEADPLHESLHVTGPAAQEIAGGLGAACTVLERFADDLDELARARNALLDAAAAPPAVWQEGQNDRGEGMNDIATRRWAGHVDDETRSLVASYTDATDRCAHELRAIPDVSWSALAGWSGPRASAALTAPTDTAGVLLLEKIASTPDPHLLLSTHPDWAVVVGRTSPDVVARWWSSLDPRVATHLCEAMPALIGNLDGVAFHARVACNRLRAQQHLDGLRRQRDDLTSAPVPRRKFTAREGAERRAERRRLDREIAYFEKVADGSKSLYAWDPQHGSLIEVTGDPSSARAALFVVPGTNADAEAFMKDEPVTDFARWQVGASGGSVVAFTVLTGPMPQLDDVIDSGPQWNHFAEERGAEYARFLRGVNATQPELWTMSYEHSYGGGVGSEAEKHDGTVDARFLAASVGAIGPYQPHPDTLYFATQAPDDINRYYAGVGFGPVGFTVRPESIPGVQIVDSGLPGPDVAAVAGYVMTQNPLYLPGIVADSVAHHTALMSGDEKVNAPVLKAVRNLLNSKGAAF